MIERNNAESKVKTLFNNFRNDLVTKSTLKIFVDEKENEHLTWEIFVELSSGFPVGSVIIDANSGDVLQKNDFGQKYVNGSGRVFDPDPGTYLRDANLNSSSDVSSAYKSATLANLNGNGYVQGKYATSSNKIGPDSLTYNANNSFSFDRYRAGFKEANIYYFIDKIRSYIDNLGLNPLWRGDYQAIQFDAIVSQYYNLGANAVYYPENNYEYILFGFNTDNPTMITGSEDQSVIIHEYGHALHDALISDGISNTPTDGSDLAGISEGIGDYLAISYRRTTQPSNPFRPNEASNYTFPSARTSIKSTANANYSTWSQENNYGKGSIWASTIMDLEYNTATDPSSGTKLGRDITTKLLLKCLYYIDASRSAIDYVNAIFQADRDLYGGSHLSTIEQVFRNRGFFSGYEVSGTISQNTTWSSYRVVTGDVTVASGVTLTISPNTFVYFDSSKIITVNGTLNAVGTSTSSITFTRSSTSGTWGGIQFNNSSSSNLQFCNIYYATNGISLYNSSPQIKYSTIENCEIGIFCDYYSSPILVGNNIKYNTSYGIRSNSFSSPNMTDNGYPGSNVIRNNSTGINTTYFCNPNLSGYMTYGNSIFDNTGYEISAYYNCYISAQRVYWGSSPTYLAY